MTRDVHVSYADRLHVGVRLDGVPTVGVSRILGDAMIEEAIARDVVVQTDDVGCTRIVREVVEVTRTDTVVGHPGAKSVLGSEPPGE